MKILNERLKELRKQLGLTLEEFGKRVGITRSAVGRIEKGERAVTEQMLISVCREFNVSESWFRTGEGEMFVEMDLEDELMQWAGTVLAAEPDDFKKRFIRMLSKLSENEWELLAKMATELVESSEKSGR